MTVEGRGTSRSNRVRRSAALGAALCAVSVLVLVPAGSSSAAGHSCHGRPATIVGTAGPDRLVGTARRDVIVARAGHDTLRGLGGADILCSGPGRDTVRGGRGTDRIVDSGGNADRLRGGAGDDVVIARGGTVGFRPLRDLIWGGSGADVLRSGRSGDLVRGGSGNDRIYGRMGHDDLIGGTGQDHLAGGRYIDTFHLTGDGDVVNGGRPDHSDWVDYRRAAAGVAVDLTVGSGMVEGATTADTLTGITSAVLSPYDDTFFGDEGQNVVDGEEGKDVLAGGPGNDWLRGGPGDDILDGGEGEEDTTSGGAGTDTCVSGERGECELPASP